MKSHLEYSTDGALVDGESALSRSLDCLTLTGVRLLRGLTDETRLTRKRGMLTSWCVKESASMSGLGLPAFGLGAAAEVLESVEAVAEKFGEEVPCDGDLELKKTEKLEYFVH